MPMSEVLVTGAVSSLLYTIIGTHGCADPSTDPNCFSALQAECNLPYDQTAAQYAPFRPPGRCQNPKKARPPLFSIAKQSPAPQGVGGPIEPPKTGGGGWEKGSIEIFFGALKMVHFFPH